eukprot:1161795-Pelagomonas_calceolata.AAC.12
MVKHIKLDSQSLDSPSISGPVVAGAGRGSQGHAPFSPSQLAGWCSRRVHDRSPSAQCRCQGRLLGAAGVYMTGALVHSAAAKVASSVQSPSPSALHGPPPVGPEVQAPSLLQQQVLQGHIPGLLSVSQHWWV